jgi:hypothetical protein
MVRPNLMDVAKMPNSARLIPALLAAVVFMAAAPARAADEQPSVMIVKDALAEKAGFYRVEGVVYNPNTKPVHNVVIKYRVWKKWQGQDGHGAAVKDNGGLLTATVKSIPPKQSTEFVASGGNNAPVVAGETPEPLKADITADWAK